MIFWALVWLVIGVLLLSVVASEGMRRLEPRVAPLLRRLRGSDDRTWIPVDVVWPSSEDRRQSVQKSLEKIAESTPGSASVVRERLAPPDDDFSISVVRDRFGRVSDFSVVYDRFAPSG